MLHALKDGRYILGLIIKLIFGNLPNENILVIPRFLGLIGLIILNNLILKQYYEKDKKILVVNFFWLLPAFNIWNNWAITFSYNYAA